MRGKAALSGYDCTAGGITPAYAGKSAIFQIKTDVHGDHPRLCGEKYRDALSSNDDAGSPPPMRGKGRRSFFDRDFHRITPAYAGKRPVFSNPQCQK